MPLRSSKRCSENWIHHGDTEGTEKSDSDTDWAIAVGCASHTVVLIFQGVLDKDRQGKAYGEIPWKLGLLEPGSEHGP